jgi:2-dehydro-3-deoxygalactonokinase
MPENFLSCDWGTSHFRLKLVDSVNLEIRGEIQTSEGAAAIAFRSTDDTRPQNFANVLAGNIEKLFRQTGHDAANCVISGMASSNIGWIELPYAAVPLMLTSSHLETRVFEIPVAGRPVAVTLISGIRTDNDVMRGEECELIGLLDSIRELAESEFYLVLPGTHSKHVHLKLGLLKGFTTYMTGELFSHLRTLPTLQAPLTTGTEASGEAFRDGVWTAQRKGLAAGLFKIRAKSVLAKNPWAATSFLSGLLIGSELMHLPKDGPCFIAASPGLESNYLKAIEQMQLSVQSIPANALNHALTRAHRLFLA